MAAKDLEKAVHYAQLYAGCLGNTSIKDAQRLYTRMIRSANAVAKRRGMSANDVLQQIAGEAARRGPKCPRPAKDY